MSNVTPINPTVDFTESREVPYNIEAEQAILGAILTNNESLNRIEVDLIPDHFYVPLHGRIYDAILRLNNRGLVASEVSLKLEFEKDEELQELGGIDYIKRLSAFISGIVNVRDYANIVYSLATSRELIKIGEDIVNDSFDETGEKKSSEQIEGAESKLFNLASQGKSESNFGTLSSAVGTAMEYAEAAQKRDGILNGVPTGFRSFDGPYGGFHNSDLIILAARPSMGKTALAINFAVNAAQHMLREYNNKPEGKIGSIGVCSLEMSSDQLATRMLAMESGVNASDIRRGKLQNNEFKNDIRALADASNQLNQLPLFIDDTPALSIAALRTRARRLKRKHNLSMLVIDYLQLMKGVTKQGTDSRVQEISEISMGLKSIAKELNIPVIALSQLSRAVEQRTDKKPQLSDLRESGSIEQDADMVLFIYRDSYYEERKKPNETDEAAFAAWQEKMEEVDRLSEILISKNRHGPIGSVNLEFDKNTTKFLDPVIESHS